MMRISTLCVVSSTVLALSANGASAGNVTVHAPTVKAPTVHHQPKYIDSFSWSYGATQHGSGGTGGPSAKEGKTPVGEIHVGKTKKPKNKNGIAVESTIPLTNLPAPK